MNRLAVGLAMVSALGATTAADGPAKHGVWQPLVQAHARWLLRDTGTVQNADTIAVETYDVRKIGGADVARLRWVLQQGTRHRDVGASLAGGRFTQLAVTPRGLYLLSASMDDAKVARALAAAPTWRDPPDAVEPASSGDGSFVRVDRSGLVCVGHVAAEGACDGETGLCEGELCVDAGGVARIAGSWAPGNATFAR